MGRHYEVDGNLYPSVTTILSIIRKPYLERLRDKLVQIASDGKINPHEVEEFETILKEMVELERWIGELKFFALRHGIDVEDIMPRKLGKSGKEVV